MKKTKFFWLLPIMVIIFLASACASPTEVDDDADLDNDNEQELVGQGLEFETLAHNFDSRYEEEMFYVIKDEETFVNLWENTLEEATIEVNFDEQMVLAIFMGEKPSGGYGIEITHVIETDNAIEVTAIETVPGEEDMVTMALTYPSHVIVLEKSDKNVIFNIN